MFYKSLSIAMLAVGTALFTGCSSMGKSDHAMKESANPKDNLVVVTGAHGGTATFAYETSSGKAKMMSMTGDMKECSACMDNVNAYYMTGKMEPTCKMCGAKFTVMPIKGSHGGM